MSAGTRRCAQWLAGVWAVAVVLAAVVTAGPAQAATAPFTYSTVAWTGTSAIIAGTNGAGDLYYWSELIGGSTFNEQLLASGQPFTGAPAIGWTGSTVIIAVSQGSQLDYWYQDQHAATRTWHEQQVAAARGTSYGPATIGWTGTSVIIAGATSHHNLDYWYEQYGTSTWHEQQVSTGVYGADYNTAFGPSIGWTGSKVIISSTDNFGGVDYFFQNAGSRTWYGQLVEPGLIPPWRGTAIGWTGSAVIITSWNQYGQLAYFSDPAGTGTWHGQSVAQDIHADPAIAWTGKSVVITDTSPQGDLEIWRQAAGARTWSNKRIAPALGARHYFGPRHLANPSIAVAGGFVIITAVDSSGNLDYWSQFGPTPWNEQQVAAG
jgi:hypothetical protein